MASEMRSSEESVKYESDRDDAGDIVKTESDGSTNGGSSEPANSHAQEKSQEPVEDPNLVTWHGSEDPDNPKNWPSSRKWAATAIVSLFAFLCPMVSAMVAPALKQEAADLGITNSIATYMSLSIFVLAWAIGPFFLGPLSEVNGRVRTLQFSNLFFLAWNVGCGFARNTSEILIFRFLAGLGASAQLGVGGGMLSDCWRSEQRGKAVGMYALAPNVGAAIGPLIGGWVAEKSTWRWLYWSTSIADALLQLVAFFYLKETHAPTILRARAQQLRRKTGTEDLHVEDGEKTLLQLLPGAFKRPFVMIGTQPIVQMLALYQAYLFGMFYLFFATFSEVFQRVYHQSVGTASLHYIALAVGFAVGGQLNTHFIDKIYLRLKKCYGNVDTPEFRLPFMMLASFLVPVGLFWYGWSTQAGLPWIMPDIGAFIFAVGSVVCVQGTQAYIIDGYQRFAASVMAAVVMLRSLAGFSFPLFAPYMFDALDYGWGNTVLGFVSIVVGIPAPILLWYHGHRLREMSQYAAG